MWSFRNGRTSSVFNVAFFMSPRKSSISRAVVSADIVADKRFLDVPAGVVKVCPGQDPDDKLEAFCTFFCLVLFEVLNSFEKFP
jgi:hypothetical protein